MTDSISLIRDSFETWYNSTKSKNHPVSIAINYSDVQTLAIKAYHTITMDVKVIGIVDNLSYTDSLITLQENYNHGVTSDEEAKYNLTKKLLLKLFDYTQA